MVCVLLYVIINQYCIIQNLFDNYLIINYDIILFIIDIHLYQAEFPLYNLKTKFNQKTFWNTLTQEIKKIEYVFTLEF